MTSLRRLRLHQPTQRLTSRQPHVFLCRGVFFVHSPSLSSFVESDTLHGVHVISSLQTTKSFLLLTSYPISILKLLNLYSNNTSCSSQ
ncbi:hypothetical protein F2Q68_00017225 [Brassica cretica]|uniref:Uncharacterized protein n=1 Tax=Brassica cretica TaxID=69181 RepID=A0A8S9HT82_BRACR|nr:hypothetical protein F2Q68_00017225 [Brassica cretica]